MTVLVFLGSLIGAMAIGMPVAFALLVCGVALMLHQGIFDSQILAQNLIIGADNFQLLAVPFFLLAGELMNAGGLSKRIVNFAVSFVGHIHGGLGYVSWCFVPRTYEVYARSSALTGPYGTGQEYGGGFNWYVNESRQVRISE
jgi:TRAP-type mannitol/chloroaromatic compound transport system permease large subunit